MNNTLINNPCIKEEITREIIKYFEINKNKNIAQQDLHRENSPSREI